MERWMIFLGIGQRKLLAFNLLILITSMSIVNVAFATVIYDEADSGDLSNVFSASTFQLSAGTNSIRGSSSLNQTSGVSDRDTFTVLLGGGLSILNVDIVFSGLSPTTATSLSAFTNLLRSSSPFTQVQRLRKNVTDNSIIDPPIGDFPLTEASYWGETSWGGVGGNQCAGGCNWDYEITYYVADARANVPEPATLILISLGLFGLGFNKRKRI